MNANVSQSVGKIIWSEQRNNAVVITGWSADRRYFGIKVVGANKPDLILDRNAMSKAMKLGCEDYGIEVRSTRAAALKVNEKTNRPASPLEKYEAVERMMSHMGSGSEEWNPQREGGTRTPPNTVLLGQAMARAFPEKSDDEILAKVASLKPEERDALLVNNPKIKKAADEIRAERLGDVKVDTESLLAGW